MTLNEMLKRWVNAGALDSDLYDIVCTLGRRCLEKSPFLNGQVQSDDTRDLAGDFLLHIRARGNTALESEAGLAREMARYLAQRYNPESNELWSILSTAARKLEKAGTIRRVGGIQGAPNSNRSVWTIAPGAQDNSTVDVSAFQQGCTSIGCYYPKGEEGRLLSPGDAQLLLVRLLQVANGPIPFQLLFSEAQKHAILAHVPVGPAGEAADDEEKLLLIGQWADMQAWAIEECVPRSVKIWERVSAFGNGKEVLCLYIIPKEAYGVDVTFASLGLGATQRVSEAKNTVMCVMAEELHAERLQQEGRTGVQDPFVAAFRILAERVLDALMKKCTENGLGSNFPL